MAIGAWEVDRAQGATVAMAAPSEVQTEPAVATANGFLLKGRVNPENLPTTYYFMYKDTGLECEDEQGCGPTTPVGGPLVGDTQQEVPPTEVAALTPGKTYHYWLIAVNAKGTALGPELTFTAPAVGQPSDVHTEPAAATLSGFQLKGSLNAENLPTRYYFVYKDTSTECEEALGCGPMTAVGGPLEGDTQQEVPPLEVTGLTPGATYRYWLVATNANGAARGEALSFVAPSPSIGVAQTLPAISQAPLSLQSAPAPPAAGGQSGASSLPLGVVRELTAHQKLSAALRVCAKKPRGRRAECERQAHRRYAALARKSRNR